METIQYEQIDGVATITLDRPASYNAFTGEMSKEIVHALNKANKDETIRCIVITGNGKAFCAGQDLAGVDEQTDYGELLRVHYHPLMKAMKQTQKPIVAAVNGVAAGAGMSLALAADFRLVQPGTRFLSAFMNIGLIPDAGFMYALPRLIGYAKALEIAVLGKPIMGLEAHQLGLATAVFDTDEWHGEVKAFAESLAALPTKSFSLVKRYMMDSMHFSYEDLLEKEAQAQQIAGMTHDHQSGVLAFKEKRKPTFSGK